MADVKKINGYDIKDQTARTELAAHATELAAHATELEEQATELAKINVNNVQEMKLLEDLQAGDVVRTLGFYSANDGGTALYKIRNKTENETIDEGFLITISETLVAEYIIDKEVNVKALGAVGDGTTDDTAAIRKAITKIQDYTIKFPKGTYLITETIEISNITNLNLNAEDTTIIYNGSNYAFKLVHINGANFKFGNIQAQNGSAINIESINQGEWSQYLNIEFDNIISSLYGIRAYVELGWINEIRIKKGRFSNMQYGVYMENNRDANSMSAWNFTEVGFEVPTIASVYLKATQGTIMNVRFKNCRIAEIVGQGAKFIVAEGAIKRLLVEGTETIHAAIVTIPSTAEDVIFNCQCVYYSNTYVEGGIIKAGVFIPNEHNFIRLIDSTKEMEQGDDLNSYSYPGTYNIPSTSVLTSLSHLPATFSYGTGKLIVLGLGVNMRPTTPNYYFSQILFVTSHVYIRNGHVSNSTPSYGDWKEITATT